MKSILTNSDNNVQESQPMDESQPMLEMDTTVTLTNNNNTKDYNPGHTVVETEDVPQNYIELIWNDLSFCANELVFKTINNIPYYFEYEKKMILDNQSGRLVSGKLTAILGPNGAGKTTLLECLGGRRKAGFTGEVFVKSKGSNKNTKVSYYSQHDILLDILSVEETLRYCCQLKSCEKGETVRRVAKKSVDRFEVERLINDFNLKKCAKTPALKCSGGQRRRLSVALEMIFSPSILLLDEPTSGLDSNSSLQCIQLVKRLSQNSHNSMIIAVVIHQPNSRLLSHFDDLYVLSSTGQCIYEGPSNKLIEKMSTFGLQCSQYCNPSDFSIEIGSGDFGMDVIQTLAEVHKTEHKQKCIKNEDSTEMPIIIANTRRHGIREQVSMVWPLTKRVVMMSIKDPKQFSLQFSAVMLMLLMMVVLHWKYKIGPFDACMKKLSFETVRDLAYGLYDILDPTYSVYPNMGFIFYSMLFIVFLSIFPTVLSLPMEVTVLRKEYLNGWYSLSSYFISKNIGDMPQNFIFPVIYSVGAYMITEQLMDWWRLLAFTGVLILMSILAQGMGFLVSSLYADNAMAAVIVGALINMPMLIFTGLLFKIQALHKIFEPMTYLSYFRLGFESLIIIIYGFDRCPSFEKPTFKNLLEEFGDQIVPLSKCVYDYDPHIMDNMTLAMNYFNDLSNKSYAYPLVVMEYHESNFWYNILFLVCYAVVLRVIAYFLLVWKIKVK